VTPRHGLLLLLAATVVCSLVPGVVYGARDGLLTFLFLGVCGGLVVAATHLLQRRRARVGSLARQLTVAIGVTAALIALGVVVIGLLMFVSPHDALVLIVLVAFAGILAAYCASVLASGALCDVAAVRDGLRAVGEGERDVRIATGGRDELAELAESANRMTAQLAERERERDTADRARRDLIAAVSHDLRTPLTSLRLLAEAVEDDVVDADTRRRYLERMSVHINSLSALIEDLFELSRLEAGEIQWSVQRVHLDELVAETVDAMRADAEAKRVTVEARVPADVAAARGNPEKLQRVLFNLVQNAIRHTPADGSVTVTATSNGSSVEVEVADTGDGIDPEDCDRVFEPFFRGSNGGSRTGDGTGLGLTICRAIVEAHGGRIEVAGPPPGARLRFSLPREGSAAARV
jgi:signal transduction histidine kinase